MKKYSDKDFLKIGNNVAGIWGGECIGYEIEENFIRFSCIEHGEKFVTDIDFKDLYKYE